MSITENTTKELSCPTCKKSIAWSEEFPYRPFCSHRCQLIDLGEWASESYSIPDDTQQDGELKQNKTEWE